MIPVVLAMFRNLGFNSNNWVSIAPGQMVVTPTLYPENSKCIDLENVLINRFVDAYKER